MNVYFTNYAFIYDLNLYLNLAEDIINYLKLKMINYYYLVTDFKNPLFVGIVGYIKNLKKFLKIVDISLDSVIIYRCQGGPDTKYIIIH